MDFKAINVFRTVFFIVRPRLIVRYVALMAVIWRFLCPIFTTLNFAILSFHVCYTSLQTGILKGSKKKCWGKFRFEVFFLEKSAFFGQILAVIGLRRSHLKAQVNFCWWLLWLKKSGVLDWATFETLARILFLLSDGCNRKIVSEASPWCLGGFLALTGYNFIHLSFTSSISF